MTSARRALPLDPDLVLGTNGQIDINAASLPLAERQRRCVERTPGEEIALLQRIGDRAGELLVGLTAKRGGAP